MDDEKIWFGELHPDGTVTDEQDLSKSQIRDCPFLIMVPEHYEPDGRCRCKDPAHIEMQEWGYKLVHLPPGVGRMNPGAR